MKELEKEIFEFIENRDSKDYYYKGILFEVFYEYKFRYENYEDYKEDIPKKLLDIEDLKHITDMICDNEYITMELHDFMSDKFRNYKEVE